MNWIPIYKKELRSYFTSPVAYVISFLFISIVGVWWFFWDLQRFVIVSMQATQNPYYAEALNVNEIVIRQLFGNLALVMLFGLPLLTMRLFAEERKAGTHELLFTLPLRDWETLLGKFLACLTVFSLMLGLTAIYPITMSLLTNPEPWPIIVGYLGMLLLGASFISFGIFVSSLTENQIVAAFGTYGLLLVLLAMGWSSSFVGPSVAEVLKDLNIFNHLQSFLKGVLDTRDVVFYVLFSYFFLFLTLRSLESKRWRG
ncbi:MAG: ABC transporter permease [Thermodesulfobacteriota bacterium]